MLPDAGLHHYSVGERRESDIVKTITQAMYPARLRAAAMTLGESKGFSGPRYSTVLPLLSNHRFKLLMCRIFMSFSKQ